MSEMRLDKGFSILWMIFGQTLGLRRWGMSTLTRRLFSLFSMSLLLSCNSDIWPETACKSFWKVDRNDSREPSRLTLV